MKGGREGGIERTQKYGSQIYCKGGWEIQFSYMLRKRKHVVNMPPFLFYHRLPSEP